MQFVGGFSISYIFEFEKSELLGEVVQVKFAFDSEKLITPGISGIQERWVVQFVLWYYTCHSHCPCLATVFNKILHSIP